MWCPAALDGANLFTEDETSSWGVCECEVCRVIPNADPSGLIASGLCDFGGPDGWTYVFDDGTEVSGLRGCVDLDQ